MATFIDRYQTAKIQHKCLAGPDRCDHDEVITPGTRYVAIIYPPWLVEQDDPEGTGVPLGEWITERYHTDCDPRAGGFW